MKINKKGLYILLTSTFFILVFGVAFLIHQHSTPSKKTPFQLIDYVKESPFAYHTNLRTTWEEFCDFSRHIDSPFGSEFIQEQVEKQLIESGLNLNSAYITLQQSPVPTAVLYAEIAHPKKFNPLFEQFIYYYDFVSNNADSSYYYSKRINLSIEKNKKYIKVGWGKSQHEINPKDSLQNSTFFREQLEPIGTGVINTTGSPYLDSTDFSTFSYALDSTFSIAINWMVQKNHPFANGENELPVYNSQKKVFEAGITMDVDAMKNYQNPYLKKEIETKLGPQSNQWKAFFNSWNGSFSIQAGGASITKHTKTITEFDDNFNQIERTVVTKDSIPDLGIYINTKIVPQDFIKLIENLPNLKVNGNKIQVAFLPPLQINQQQESVQFSAINKKYIITNTNTIAYAHWKNQFFQSEFSAIQSNRNTVQLEFTVKDITEIPQGKELRNMLIW